jgi:CBS domain-containing protein
VVTIKPDATIVQAARLMLQKKISGLPVVDADHTLVGVGMKAVQDHVQ